MEEPPTVTNVEVSNHIPDDIILSILSKLSLKSFKRFECVPKSWSILFDDPYFMTIYRNNFLSKDRSYYDDTCLLVGTNYYEQYTPMDIILVHNLYSLSGENFENSVKLDWQNPLPHDAYLVPDEDEDEDEDENYFGLGIIGSASVNGILCLYTFDDTEWILILWNPTTNEFKLLPSSTFPFGVDDIPRHHLFGYDRIEDDYKVIRFVESDGGYDKYGNLKDSDELETFWEIYSLKGNLWHTIDDDMPLFNDNKDVYMDGVSHWWDKGETHNNLVSFDFSNESFTTTPIPSYIDDDDSFEVRKDLVILNGSIAFVLNYKKTSTIHISILGELGVKESWTKLFIVGPSPYLNYPIVAAKKGKILFRSIYRSDKQALVWFDLSTGMIDEIDVTTQISGSLSRSIMFHKESILPIPLAGLYNYGY